MYIYIYIKINRNPRDNSRAQARCPRKYMYMKKKTSFVESTRELYWNIFVFVHTNTRISDFNGSTRVEFKRIVTSSRRRYIGCAGTILDVYIYTV